MPNEAHFVTMMVLDKSLVNLADKAAEDVSSQSRALFLHLQVETLLQDSALAIAKSAEVADILFHSICF